MKIQSLVVRALAVASALLCTAPPCKAQTNLALDVRMYAGLNITGEVGTLVQIQYAADLAQTNLWRTLTNISLTTTQQLWLDTTSPATGRRFYRAVVNPIPTNMVLIPAGEFIMGDTFSESSPYERPVHLVYISGMYMDKYLVTKTLWDAAKTWAVTNGYTFDNPGSGKADNHPVQQISWYDAVKWCNARSQMEGLSPCYYADPSLTVTFQTGRTNPSVNWQASGYRLPTEAEWEKAARGGVNGHRFPWPTTLDTISQTLANYFSSWWNGHPVDGYDVNPTSGYPAAFSGGATPYTSPVGYFAANAYGLYDMAGNVYGYCWDWYDSSWYNNPNATKPDTRGPAASPELARTKRGGSWYYVATAASLRCACRQEVADPAAFSDDIGFRCVRGL